MAAATGSVRAELERMLQADTTRVGDVYRLSRRGLDAPAIAVELGVSTSGFVSNNRTIIKAILDGVLPRGSKHPQQVASAIGKRRRNPDLTRDAQAHLEAVLASLDARTVPSREAAPRSTSQPLTARLTNSLRAQVDGQLRDRTRALIERVSDEAQIDADDYQRVVSGTSALDQLRDLVLRDATGRTSNALIASRRTDLTIEQAVLDWADDLSFTSDLVAQADARLEYWMKHEEAPPN